MKIVKTAGLLVIIFVMNFALVGCGDKFWDPTQVGRFRPVPAVNVILDSLGVAEETPAAWETGEDPRPSDVIAYDTDYVFGPGDVISISVFELFNDGTMFTGQYVITETGKISIPDVGIVDAAGLTESQLEEEIKQILSPNILKEPSVGVTLLRSQSRQFSILGSGIPRSSRYEIPRYDFRLTDALATAGGISQFNISYIYVSRPITGEEALTPGEAAPSVETPAVAPSLPDLSQPGAEPDRQGERPAPVKRPADEMLEIIAPSVHGGRDGVVLASTELITDEELAELNRIASPEKLSSGSQYPPSVTRPASRGQRAQYTTRNTRDETESREQDVQVQKTQNDEQGVQNTQQQVNDSRIEWIFQDGRWVPIQIPSGGKAGPAQAPGKPTEQPRELLERKAPTGMEWDQVGAGGADRRVIRIPADKLLSGDPRYNIVVRPGDNIHVPLDIIGEFCIMGNVNAQGFINMTGRPMTLKMAIAAAGGLGPLAWPKRCEVVRRIGKKREEIVMVDLDKIASGEQPDFFIKPNDLINVGTHPTARWRAVLRNAFRATYGFGFIYDRNFADRDYGTSRPFPSWF